MRRFGLYFLFLTVNLAGFYFFLTHTHHQFGGDWTDVFGPLSLFTRSAVWHYSTLPIHFPWRCGGSDLMVNPQTHLFSPFVILDILFPPTWAILLTMILFGLLGMISIHRLLQSLGVSTQTSFVGSVLFINSSWFALHFTEGHLTYAEMQLLPAVLLLAKTLHERKSLFLLGSLLALMILNGAIQTLIFSLLLLFSSFYLFPDMLKKIQDLGWRRFATFFATLFLLTAPKTIPVAITLHKRPPMLDSTVMSPRLLFTSLLYPWQEMRMSVTEGMPYVFHEFGCYLGWTASLLILVMFWKKPWLNANRKFLILFLFWLWIGSGWGTPLNPWMIFQRIPVLNQAHLQSRLFILMFVFFVILSTRALDSIRSRTLFYALAILMLFESGFVRWHITKVMAAPSSYPAPATKTFIESDNLDVTVHYGIPIQHYLTKNRSATDCQERAFFPSSVLPNDHPNYKGEVYFVSNKGQASISRFTPSRVSVDYSSEGGGVVEVNSNHLWGWNSETPGVSVLSKRFGENIKAQVPSGSGSFTLVYRPKYLIPCLVLFALGLFFYIKEWLRLRRA